MPAGPARLLHRAGMQGSAHTRPLQDRRNPAGCHGVTCCFARWGRGDHCRAFIYPYQNSPQTITGLSCIPIRTAHRPLQAFHVFLSEQATDHYRAFMYPYQNRPQTISGLSCIPIRTGLMYLYQNRPQDHFCQPSQTLTRLHRCMPQHTRISCIRARCAPSSGSTPFSMAMLCRGKGNNLLIDRWSCLSGLFDYPVLVPRPSLLTLNATIGRCGDLCTTGRCGDLCTSRELCFGAKRNGPCDGSGYYQAHPGVLGRAPSD